MPIDATDVTEALQTFAERMEDGTLALSAFDLEVKAEMGLEWRLNAKASGGTVRGDYWDGFKDQYTRLTDGETIPAWGGTRKVKIKRVHTGFNLAADPETGWLGRGAPLSRAEADGYENGTVLGRKRPSNQRVTEQSILNIDTGRLANAILTRTPWIRLLFGSTILRIGNVLPHYAHYVLVELGRNPLKWIPDDEAKLRRHISDWHETVAFEFNTRGA